MSDYHPVVGRIKQLLDAADLTYKTFEHEAVRTSEEAAAVRPGNSMAQGAKSLIVRVKRKDEAGKEVREFAQVVVPGDQKFDTKKVRQVLNASDIRFATEAEVGAVTDGIVPGGVPPFGNLFGLPVIVEQTLLKNDEIIFSAGDKRVSIAMASRDYTEVVKPIVVPVI